MSNRPYPDGFDTVVAAWESRRDPLIWADKGLPQADADLEALANEIVKEQPVGNVGFRLKKKTIAKEFIGLSSLSLLNACLIATLRKREWPDHAPALFCRIWQEHSDHLLRQLDLRWKVSSISTFSDHGQTESQRRLGQSLSILFGMMKLYETERLFSGHAPSQPFRRGQRSDAGLPLKMDPYSIRNGGLDVNLLAPIREDADKDPVAGPLAINLLETLVAADNTVFARLAEMRRRWAQKESQ